MLFCIQASKIFSTEGLVVDCPENLYNLGILKGLGQQELKLKDEILNQFIFCHVVREVDGIRIALEEQVMEEALQYQIKRGGEIIGLEQVTKPYSLRYRAAKVFHDSHEFSYLAWIITDCVLTNTAIFFVEQRMLPMSSRT
jgi:hypothetical protein